MLRCGFTAGRGCRTRQCRSRTPSAPRSTAAPRSRTLRTRSFCGRRGSAWRCGASPHIPARLARESPCRVPRARGPTPPPRSPPHIARFRQAMRLRKMQASQAADALAMRRAQQSEFTALVDAQSDEMHELTATVTGSAQAPLHPTPPRSAPARSLPLHAPLRSLALPTARLSAARGGPG